MASKNKKTSNVKVKKKKWYPIYASKNFNEKLLGETYLSDSSKILNKFVGISLSVLTENMRDQNVNLVFKVVSVKDNKGYTELLKYRILPSFIKRFVRRDKSKITDSFTAKDKNKNIIRIKPLIITLNKVTKNKKTEIRKLTKEFLKKELQSMSFEEFVNNLIKYNIQKKLKSILKKISPIRFAEIRFIGFEDHTKLKELKTTLENTEKEEKQEEKE